MLGSLSVVLPVPIGSVHVAALPVSAKRSFTLLPNVVAPVIVQAVGRPDASVVIVSARVGPRPLSLKSKSMTARVPCTSAFRCPTFFSPMMTTKLCVAAVARHGINANAQNAIASCALFIAIPIESTLVDDDLSVLQHDLGFQHLVDIQRRVAVDQDDVGTLSRLERPDLIGHADVPCRVRPDDPVDVRHREHDAV